MQLLKWTQWEKGRARRISLNKEVETTNLCQIRCLAPWFSWGPVQALAQQFYEDDFVLSFCNKANGEGSSRRSEQAPSRTDWMDPLIPGWTLPSKMQNSVQIMAKPLQRRPSPQQSTSCGTIFWFVPCFGCSFPSWHFFFEGSSFFFHSSFHWNWYLPPTPLSLDFSRVLFPPPRTLLCVLRPHHRKILTPHTSAPKFPKNVLFLRTSPSLKDPHSSTPPFRCFRKTFSWCWCGSPHIVWTRQHPHFTWRPQSQRKKFNSSHF